MNKEIHFFDLDGTLWKIHSDIWLIDKEKPFKPIIKISNLEFSLIRNGIYKKDNIPIEYNGGKYYISREMYDRVYRKTKFENIKRLGISFNNLYDKKILDKTKVDYLLDNIEHLRGKNVSIGLLTARSNRKNHSDIVNKLRLELKNMGLSLDKIYFVGDKFKVYYDEETSLKKVYILLEHLIGFKIKNNRFVPLRQDWYNIVHFYDDHKTNIDYANDCQKILNDLLKNTDDDLFKIITERINTNDIVLYNHLVTNNDLNRFDTNEILIEEPDKFPIKESNKLDRFYEFNEEFNNPFIKGKDRKIVDKIYNILKDKLDSGDTDYNYFVGDTSAQNMYNYYKSITIKNNGRIIEIKDYINKYIINIGYNEEDNEFEEDDNLYTNEIEIKNSSYKLSRIINKLIRNKKRSTSNSKFNDKNDIIDFDF